MKKKFIEKYSLLLQSTFGKMISVIAILGLVAVVIFLPYFVSKYMLRIVIMIALYMIMALALNMVVGYLGQISLGHAAFYAVGGYTSCLLVMKLGVNYWVAALCAGVMAALFGLLLGWQTMRLSGAYLAIVSLGYFYVIRMIITNWMSLTNGSNGLLNIPPATFLGKKLSIFNGGSYYHILFFLALTILVTYLITRSKFGRAITSVREDELAADLMGIYTMQYKLLAFSISGFFMGLAGSFYAHFLGYINPNTFTYDISITILCIVILGGRGTIKGMLIGAALLSPLGEVLRALTNLMKSLPPWMQIKQPEQWRFVIYGVIMVVMMRYRPQGLLGGRAKGPYKLPKGLKLKEGEVDVTVGS